MIESWRLEWATQILGNLMLEYVMESWNDGPKMTIHGCQTRSEG